MMSGISEKSENTTQQERMIHAEQVSVAYGHVNPGTIAIILNVITLAYVVQDVVPALPLVYWVCYMLLVSAGLLLIGQRFHSLDDCKETCSIWKTRFIVSVALLGIGWGSGVILFYPQIDGMERTILLIIIAGVIAAGSASISTLYSAYLVFNLSILVPLIFVALLPPVHGVIAFLSSLYMVFMLIAAWRYSNTIYTALALRFEKTLLLDELNEEIRLRNRAETGLIKKEHSLESAQRIAHLGNWEWYSKNNRFVLSREMIRLLSMDMDQVEIDPDVYLSRVSEADKLRLKKVREEAIESSEPYRVEYKIITRDGHERHLEEYGEPAGDNPDVKLSAAVLDITERKAMDTMKDEFISIVSHELRTPLTSTSGSLALLKGGVVGSLSEKAERLVDTAYRNAWRLVKIVNDILDINKLEFTGLPLSIKKCNLCDIIKTAIAENQGYADTLHVTFMFKEMPSTCLVEGDRDRLTQVMTNLLSNAAKYSPEGAAVDVIVRDEKQWLWVGVHDTGPGIPDEFQDKLFKKFSQGDTSNSRYQYGTGLGLSICKLIIDKHGGEIGFDTKLGKGSCFYFRLPKY